MRNARRLFILVARASLMTDLAYLAYVLLALILGSPVLRLNAPEGLQALVIMLATAILPSIAASFWIFGRLRHEYPREEARAASIAFALFNPVSLLLGLLLG